MRAGAGSTSGPQAAQKPASLASRSSGNVQAGQQGGANRSNRPMNAVRNTPPSSGDVGGRMPSGKKKRRSGLQGGQEPARPPLSGSKAGGHLQGSHRSGGRYCELHANAQSRGARSFRGLRRFQHCKTAIESLQSRKLGCALACSRMLANCVSRWPVVAHCKQHFIGARHNGERLELARRPHKCRFASQF